MSKEIAMSRQILRGVVGSTAHGLELAGTDDRDEMGVFMEPPENVLGLESLDHYIQRDQPDGVRSQPGDLDLTMYSFRKFIRLAAAGNPSVIVLLWLPKWAHCDEFGKRLVEMRRAFVTQESGKRFLGYLVAQKKRLTGVLSRAVNRPELVAAHGYHTKFAMHALRLGYQGVHLMREGGLTLPLVGYEKDLLMHIRRGEIKYEEAVALIEEVEKQLTGLVEICRLRLDESAVNSFMTELQLDYWKEHGEI